ncbi:hexokinase-3-like isoform X4 [Musa acuminata AAA Group]|uniref:Phosphotransferase n=1 Tax=Musa acuminata subsp. malaccensis TaxID=214687 RepID=A0A804L4L9_MUSAM|nr:PREDICTED: hexokinase-3-like isoform X1 [Musa acuminata subsp. malaccensis]
MGRVGLGVAVGCAVVTCAIAAALVGRRARSWWRWARVVGVVGQFEEDCVTPVWKLRQVVDAMVVEMHAGLASDGGSKLKMLLTFVDTLPDGNEDGVYYALDLRGTICRVLKVQLGGSGSKIINHKVEQQRIPEELVSGTSEELFDFIALTLKEFIEREENGQVPGSKKELGFTFSFPIRQLSVSSGVLIKWTKGFTIEDVVGKDVSQCLEEAMSKNGLHMQVAALVNDPVGTLAVGHYDDADTVAAVIIGYGTNACYVERSDAIIKYQGLLTDSGFMIVNMEWGNFWSSHLPRTCYDIALDDESPNRNDQGYEKMISGMYLGEIVRRVLHRIAEVSDIFGDSAHHLSVPFILRTPLMAAMHEDDSPDLREVGRILEESLQTSGLSLKAKMIVVRVCDVVTRRAARLAAAGIIGILKKIGRDGSGGVASGRTKGKPRRTVVAIERGLYTNYSMFRVYMNEAITDILGQEIAQNVVLRVSEDGAGIGAALLAAAYSSKR